MKFVCLSSEPVKWYFEENFLPLNALTGSEYDSHWLIINNVQMPNAGKYQCYGKGSDDFLFVSEAELIIKSKFHDLVIF